MTRSLMLKCHFFSFSLLLHSIYLFTCLLFRWLHFILASKASRGVCLVFFSGFQCFSSFFFLFSCCIVRPVFVFLWLQHTFALDVHTMSFRFRNSFSYSPAFLFSHSRHFIVQIVYTLHMPNVLFAIMLKGNVEHIVAIWIHFFRFLLHSLTVPFFSIFFSLNFPFLDQMHHSQVHYWVHGDFIAPLNASNIKHDQCWTLSYR